MHQDFLKICDTTESFKMNWSKEEQKKSVAHIS